MTHSHPFLIILSLLVLVAINEPGSSQESAAKPDVPAQPTSAAERTDSWQRHLKLQKESPFRQIPWQAVGPRKSGGRIETIASPKNNSSTLYVGAGSGGLWKTVNNGTTWKPVFENQPTCAIGDVAVSQTDSNTVWLGTGEVLMARSALPGFGVFKSTDAGETWKNMGLKDTHHIGRVLIDPTDANTVYVVAIGHRSTANQNRGVFKTSDGGETWTKILYIDDRTSAIDMVIEPGNPETLYVTTWQRDTDGQDHYGPQSGVYKSIDSGKNWKRLKGGLPAGNEIGRIGIDVAASNPQVIYAIVDGKKEDGIYRSANGGESWKRVNQTAIPVGWDWCEVRVSPDDENTLYSIGQNSFLSRDGGKTFEKIAGTIVHLLDHPSPVLHLDTHSMWINPENTNHVVFGNDGGLFVTYDQCKTWLHLNNFPITEVYAVTYDMAEPYNIYIGTQDNAALFGPSTHRPRDGIEDAWQHVYIDRWGGGDSYFTYRDPTDENVIYYEHQFGGMRRKDMKTGKVRGIRPPAFDRNQPLRFAWMTPFFPSVHQPTTLYAAANHVFKSTNRGDQWKKISPDLTVGPNPRNIRYQAITALEESVLKPGFLLAGTDNGNVYRTLNDGETWEAIHDGLPRYAVTRVITSPHRPEKLFVSFNGMSSDDFSPYLFRSDDQGKTWKSISQGLPLEPIHVIREDPLVKDRLFVGTDLSVYVSENGGKTWHSLRNNLPTTSVQDLCVHPRENELVIGTHGRGVFVLDLDQLDRK